MFQKTSFILVLIATIIIATCSSSEEDNFRHPSENDKDISHNVAAGKRDPDDRLTYLGLVTKLKSRNSVVSVEKTFNASKNGKITQVVARNQSLGKYGGYAKILKGGPGHQNVTLQFTSQKNHGIFFLVEIFSKS
uniref:Lipoprotein n=1 Tax=Bracon brevicornis TaxID=1563983 RepID=A0A6V7IZS8_9HYME